MFYLFNYYSDPLFFAEYVDIYVVVLLIIFMSFRNQHY